MTAAELETLQDLETQLLTADARKSAGQLQLLLADDFIEIGQSGRRYNKADVINRLPGETARTFEIAAMQALELDSRIVLLTYTLHEPGRKSHRSSLWKKQNEAWQLVFHQGTGISEMLS